MRVERAFSKAAWEGRVGYCRAIRADNHIYVTGTAPVGPDGAVFAPDDDDGRSEIADRPRHVDRDRGRRRGPARLGSEGTEIFPGGTSCASEPDRHPYLAGRTVAD